MPRSRGFLGVLSVFVVCFLFAEIAYRGGWVCVGWRAI